MKRLFAVLCLLACCFPAMAATTILNSTYVRETGRIVLPTNASFSGLAIGTNRASITNGLHIRAARTGTDYFRIDHNDGTLRFQVGVYPAVPTLASVWLGDIVPDSDNWSLIKDSTQLALSAPSGGSLLMCINGSAKWSINSSGHLLAQTDASLRIGSAGANRPLSIDVSGYGTFGGVLTASNALFTSLSLTGVLAAPSTPVVTPVVPGSTTWSYKMQVMLADGRMTPLSAVGTTTTGAATLSIGNDNYIIVDAYPGAAKYLVFRTAAGGTPSTTGLLATLDNRDFLDYGYPAADGITIPTTGGSGRAYVEMLRVGDYTDDQLARVGVEGDMSVHGSVRSTGVDNFQSGAGVELQYIGGEGHVLSFNRNTLKFRPLYLNYGAVTNDGPVIIGQYVRDWVNDFQVWGSSVFGTVNNTNKQVFVNTNGFLGVGVTPTSKFQVAVPTYGDPAFTVFDGAYNYNLGYYNSQTGAFRMSLYGSASDFYIQTYTETAANGAIRFVPQEVVRMSIMPNGFVGIGTLDPGCSLDVTGQVRSASAIFTNSVNSRTNIGILDVTTNIFVLGTRYTNSNRRLFVSASIALTAAAAGTATVALYVENLGTATNSMAVSAGPLASLVTTEPLFLPVGPGMIYYFADETSGAGASATILGNRCSRIEW